MYRDDGSDLSETYDDFQGVFWSTDGLTWEVVEKFISSECSIVWSGEQWVVIAFDGYGNSSYSSRNGVDWTYRGRGLTIWDENNEPRYLHGTLGIRSICWTGNNYIAVGDRMKIHTSSEVVSTRKMTVAGKDSKSIIIRQWKNKLVLNLPTTGKTAPVKVAVYELNGKMITQWMVKTAGGVQSVTLPVMGAKTCP